MKATGTCKVRELYAMAQGPPLRCRVLAFLLFVGRVFRPA